MLIIYIILEQASVNAHFPPQNVGLAQLNIENMHLQYKCPLQVSSNNKTLNAHLLARVITGCHYT